jgi:glycosyltransferase involved in cell wall biosynthesis
MDTSQDNHSVSVIIPTVGRPTLAQAQSALARQTRPPDEVITIIDHARRGISWARNEGIRQAKGDLIAISDDDGLPPEDWLERLIQGLDVHQAAAAGGTYTETDPLLDEIRQLRKMPDTTLVDTVGYAGNGGTILFRREWLERCSEKDGYVYDESIPSGQDWEFIWRLRRHGGVIVYVPVKTVHLRNVTCRSYLRHQFNRGVGIAILYKIQRRASPGLAVQESLLWGHTASVVGARWLKAVWFKAIGPFCYGHFSCARFFWTHWLAEKIQGAGFLWGLMTR